MEETNEEKEQVSKLCSHCFYSLEETKSAFEVYQKQQHKKKRRLIVDPERLENLPKKTKPNKKNQVFVKNRKLEKIHKSLLVVKKKNLKKLVGPVVDISTEKSLQVNHDEKTPFSFGSGPLSKKLIKKTKVDTASNDVATDDHIFPVSTTELLKQKEKAKAKLPEIAALSNNNLGKKIKRSIEKVQNGNISSEEEIPTLVPIIRHKDKPNSKTQKHFEKNGKIKSKKRVVSFNPVTYSLGTFKWLIDPISPKDFFANYWEKNVLHIERFNNKYYDNTFSSRKLDQILRENSLHFTRNIDVVTYENGKKEVMDEEGRALPAKLWDYYNNGCSVRVLNPHTYDQNVHAIISNLQEYFGSMVGTNAYLTPPNSQGFAPHFDDIEAFIVQLEGSKYWKLYKPQERDMLARDSSHNFDRDELDDPFMEVKLNAGDLLYFPRGTIHEGRTQDEHSLHITVSVYQHTAYVDLLEHALPAALKKAATENIEFRKGLPLNYLKHLGAVNEKDDSVNRKLIVDKLKSLVATLVDYLDVDSAADNLGRKFMHDAMPPLYSKEEADNSCKCDGDYMVNGRVYNRVEIGSEIKIRLLRYYALRVVKESSGTSKIYFCTDNAKTYHGEEEQWLEIDNSLIPGLEILQKHYPEFVEVERLPIADETEKLNLVSTLWEHGLIVTDGPLPISDSESEREGSSGPSESESD